MKKRAELISELLQIYIKDWVDQNIIASTTWRLHEQLMELQAHTNKELKEKLKKELEIIAKKKSGEYDPLDASEL